MDTTYTIAVKFRDPEIKKIDQISRIQLGAFK